MICYLISRYITVQTHGHTNSYCVTGMMTEENWRTCMYKCKTLIILELIYTYLPYTVITGDKTDPTSLVTLHLYCSVVPVIMRDILLLLLTVTQFPESFLSQ